MEEHLERARRRHEEWPWDASSRPSAVQKHRARAQSYADSNGIPMFASFADALNAALDDEATPNGVAQPLPARA
jgi:hypothetical protein